MRDLLGKMLEQAERGEPSDCDADLTSLKGEREGGLAEEESQPAVEF